MNELQIVIGRFKEPLNWLKDDPFNKFKVIIYNKGDDNNFYTSENVTQVVNLPNWGLEVHSFLYHIIHNYDNLANITAFFQGSIDLPHKYDRAAEIISFAERYNRSILAHQWGQYKSIQKCLYDFTIDKHPMSHKTLKLDENNINTVPCKIRPFGKWFNTLFGDKVVHDIAYNHIMAIRKEDILKYPIEYYENLVTYVETDIGKQPEAVHYFERAWAAVFYPLNGVKIVLNLTKLNIKSLMDERTTAIFNDRDRIIGTEHYPLFNAIGMQLHNAQILEIGTCAGKSILAFSGNKNNNNRLYTFDINITRVNSSIIAESGAEFSSKNLLDPHIREQNRTFILASDIIYIDIDPHTGILELEMINWLNANYYQGLIILDDIYLGKPGHSCEVRAELGHYQNLWIKIDEKYKKCISHIGHFSGTGLVCFDFSKHELNLEPNNFLTEARNNKQNRRLIFQVR